jgi:hypothetical protein
MWWYYAIYSIYRCINPADTTRGGLHEVKGEGDNGIPGSRLCMQGLPRFGPSKRGNDQLLLIWIDLTVGYRVAKGKVCD